MAFVFCGCRVSFREGNPLGAAKLITHFIAVIWLEMARVDTNRFEWSLTGVPAVLAIRMNVYSNGFLFE